MYSPIINYFTHTAKDPLPGPALIIVDEFSMVNLELANALFDAIAANMKVIVVGDIKQLPCIGAGSVLRDMINCKYIPVTELSYNHRQAEGSEIARSANLIAEGHMPLLASDNTSTELEFISTVDAAAALDVICSIVKSKEIQGLSIYDWQILTAMRKGHCGIYSLNKTVREIILGSDTKNGVGADNFKVGDKVMVTKNNYGLGVLNGDIGTVTAIDIPKSVIVVCFPDNDLDHQIVTFSKSDINILMLAYASTIHKAQGSEFDTVIMPVVSEQYIMLIRNLLYTGITRAKKRLIIVGDRLAIRRAVSNNIVPHRNSNLTARIDAILDNLNSVDKRQLGSISA